VTRRRLAVVAAAAAALAGFLLVFLTAPRLTVLNEGFRLEYGWVAITGAALAAIGAIALAALLPAVPARGMCAFLAVIAVVLGVQRGAWQIGADRAALSARTLTDTSRIAWPEVRQVHSDPDALQVTGFGDATIRIGISGLRPHDRATLERTISRRVQESAPSATR
jgi:hypothetical protein